MRGTTTVAIASALLAISTASYAQRPLADFPNEAERRERAHVIACRQSARAVNGHVDTDEYLACKRRLDQRSPWDDYTRASSNRNDRSKVDAAECEFLSRLDTPDGRVTSTLRRDCVDERMRARTAAEVTANDARIADAQRAEAERAAAAARASLTRDDANQQQLDEQYRRGIAEYEKEQADAARRLAQLKTKCGKDFMHIDVGMPWPRVSECSGPFRRVGGVTTAAGNVTQYRNGAALVSVKDDVVIQWLAMR